MRRPARKPRATATRSTRSVSATRRAPRREPSKEHPHTNNMTMPELRKWRDDVKFNVRLAKEDLGHLVGSAMWREARLRGDRGYKKKVKEQQAFIDKAEAELARLARMGVK